VDPVVLATGWGVGGAPRLRLAAASPAVFITLGDAMLYSTWSYVLAALRRADPDASGRTIPGVTAMSACAAAVGRPLAEGREPLLVWPDEPPADAAPLLALAPNIVFMKAGRHLEDLAGVAEQAGAEAVAVRRAAQAGARIMHNLRACADQPDYFTTVLMHRVAGGASADSRRPAPPPEEACS
jgi:precorrin-2/cobalt-factor-2 C20-methyltransferase